MFQIGKTYISKLNKTVLYTVLYQIPEDPNDIAFVSYPVGKQTSYRIIRGSINFEEYSEPK